MIVIALGGNIAGKRGTPGQTFAWAVREMAKNGIVATKVSSLYLTSALGLQGQPDYLNAVMTAHCPMSAFSLLRCLKSIESLAGRTTGLLRVHGRWGERPLDLDIIDYKGFVTRNYSRFKEKCTAGEKLVLPHPHAHLRPFVVFPLLEIAPFWHHPASGLSAMDMWARLRLRREGAIMGRERWPAESGL